MLDQLLKVLGAFVLAVEECGCESAGDPLSLAENCE